MTKHEKSTRVDRAKIALFRAYTAVSDADLGEDDKKILAILEKDDSIKQIDKLVKGITTAHDIAG